MASASECTGKIDEFLAEECAAGRIMGPFSRDLVPMVHVSRLRAVPKSTPGRYRLIVDLSHPEGHRVNDGIPKAHCSLTYVSVEQAAQSVLKLGRGALLAKVDIWNAYKNVPVHPDDRWLLGISWRGGTYSLTPFSPLARDLPPRFSIASPMLWNGWLGRTGSSTFSTISMISW